MSDLDPLEQACLTGLICEEHGFRYRPMVGADAVRQALVSAMGKARPEVRAVLLKSLREEYGGDEADYKGMGSLGHVVDAVLGVVGRAIMLHGDDVVVGLCDEEPAYVEEKERAIAEERAREA